MRNFLIVFVAFIAFGLSFVFINFFVLDTANKEHCKSGIALVLPGKCVDRHVEVTGWVGWVGTEMVRVYMGPWEERWGDGSIENALGIPRNKLEGFVDDEMDYLGDYVYISGKIQVSPFVEPEVFHFNEVFEIERLFFNHNVHREQLEERMYSL